MIRKEDIVSPSVEFGPEPVAPSAVPRAAEAAPRLPRRAILTIHGMGQQIPFETIDAFTIGLVEEDKRRRKELGLPPPPPALARNVKVGAKVFQCTELELGGPSGPVEVDVYEAYWAPFTEGRVELKQVFGFLMRGAGRGLVTSLRPFRRWMFGGIQTFDRHWKTTLAFVAGACFVLVLLLLNLGAVPVLLRALKVGPQFERLTPAVVEDLTALAIAFFIPIIACGLLMKAALWLKRKDDFERLVHTLALILWPLLALVVVCAVGTLSGFGVLAFRNWSQPEAQSLFGWPRLTPKWTILVWLGVFVATLWIRRFLIQYVGDVAAYVSPETLDRFYELRNEIKDFAAEIGRGLYQQKAADGEAWLYRDVIVVGHSLGSVVAYDLLDRLIVEDTLGAGLGVLDRTRGLLTFGSPLDKTAFIFGFRGSETGVPREILAARVQPLIDSYDFRTFPWVNVFSAADLVSGRLRFYDTPSPPSGAARRRRVWNRRDPDAKIPLAAHLEYWHNPTLFRRLHRLAE